MAGARGHMTTRYLRAATTVCRDTGDFQDAAKHLRHFGELNKLSRSTVSEHCIVKWVGRMSFGPVERGSFEFKFAGWPKSSNW